MLLVQITIRARCTSMWWSLSVTCDRSVVFSGSFTIKTDRHDITVILLKVVLNTINQTWNTIVNKTDGREIKKKKINLKFWFFLGDHAYCKNKTTSELRNKLLDDSRQPTSSRFLPGMDMDTFTRAKEIDLLKSFKFQNEEQESNSVVSDLNWTNIFTSLSQKSSIKHSRKIQFGNQGR